MRILLIEDDISICDAVRYSLENEGYDVDICRDGEEAILWFMQRNHDIILLDRILPKRDGVSVLREAREKGVNTPVIITTAIDGSTNVIDGLDAGADDYLTKPYDSGELRARIRACSRRPRDWRTDSIITFKELTLNVKARSLEWRNSSCELTQRETTLFEVLMKNNGSVVARDDVFAYIWGPDADCDKGSLDTYIWHARIRLKELSCPIQIQTIRNTGFCLRG